MPDNNTEDSDLLLAEIKGMCLKHYKVAAIKSNHICMLFMLVCFSQTIHGQSTTTDDWQVRFTPYFYLPSAKADLDISGLSGDVDLSYSDVLKYLDFTAMGRIEASKDRWELMFDGIFMDLEIAASFTSPTTGNVVDLSLDERVGRADFGLGYLLIEERFGENNLQRISFKPFCGLRYAYLLQEVSVSSTGTTLGHSEDWVEPFVGGLILWDLNETISLGIRGDIGGFGIGSASDLTWQIAFETDYQLSDKISVNAGYRFIDLDYHRGSGLEELGIDVQAKGPFIGLTIGF